jgi:hypothetical protein
LSLQQKWELEDLKKEWRRKIAIKQTMFVKQQQAEIDAFRLRVVAGESAVECLQPTFCSACSACSAVFCAGFHLDLNLMRACLGAGHEKQKRQRQGRLNK